MIKSRNLLLQCLLLGQYFWPGCNPLAFVWPPAISALNRLIRVVSAFTQRAGHQTLIFKEQVGLLWFESKVGHHSFQHRQHASVGNTPTIPFAMSFVSWLILISTATEKLLEEVGNYWRNLGYRDSCALGRNADIPVSIQNPSAVRIYSIHSKDSITYSAVEGRFYAR